MHTETKNYGPTDYEYYMEVFRDYATNTDARNREYLDIVDNINKCKIEEVIIKLDLYYDINSVLTQVYDADTGFTIDEAKIALRLTEYVDDKLSELDALAPPQDLVDFFNMVFLMHTRGGITEDGPIPPEVIEEALHIQETHILDYDVEFDLTCVNTYLLDYIDNFSMH